MLLWHLEALLERADEQLAQVPPPSRQEWIAHLQAGGCGGWPFHEALQRARAQGKPERIAQLQRQWGFEIPVRWSWSAARAAPTGSTSRPRRSPGLEADPAFEGPLLIG